MKIEKFIVGLCKKKVRPTDPQKLGYDTGTTHLFFGLKNRAMYSLPLLAL